MITGFFPGSMYGDPISSSLAISGSVVVPPVVSSGVVTVVISYPDSLSTIPVYDKLDVVRVVATFNDAVTGGVVDPVSRTFRLRTPDGVVSTATVPMQFATGVWYVELTANLVGTYRYRWEVTGGSEDGQFIVHSTLVH